MHYFGVSYLSLLFSWDWIPPGGNASYSDASILCRSPSFLPLLLFPHVWWITRTDAALSVGVDPLSREKKLLLLAGNKACMKTMGHTQNLILKKLLVVHKARFILEDSTVTKWRILVYMGMLFKHKLIPCDYYNEHLITISLFIMQLTLPIQSHPQYWPTTCLLCDCY